MTRAVVSRVSSFRGLNDRRRLPALAPGEFADSMNVELSRRAAEKRFGFTRLGDEPLKNGSLRLDGVNDYVRIKNVTGFSPAQKVYLGIAVVLRSKPVAGSPETVWSWGFGTGADLNADLRYVSDGGTGSLGAWVLRVRDSSGAVTVTVTLDDGNGDDSIIGQYRYLEAVWSSAETTLAKWTFAGADAIATGAGIAAFNHGATQDLFVGVGTTALNTIGTDFIDATIAELRYSWGTTAFSGLPASPTNFHYKRELTAARIASSISGGYWKFNDGMLLPSCEDSGPYGNDAVIVNNPASWLLQSDEVRVLGESAITFNGGNGWCDVRDIDGTKVAFTFNATAPNVSRWTIRLVLILPALPAGYTTWPDGVILWAGTSTTLPSPVAIQVTSDKFVATYNDNGTPRVCTLNTPLVTSLAGKRMRMAFYRTGTGTGSVVLGLAVDNGDGTITTYFAATACTASAPSVVSSDWAIGRHVTNFDTARLNDVTAFHTDGAFFGTIDDFQIIHTNQLLLPVGLGSGVGAGATNPLNIFQEIADWGGGPAANSTQLYLKFNDGAGNTVQSTGPNATDALGGWRVYLRPETDDGARWDIGLVDPYLPVRGTLLFPYNRFLSDGSRVRSLLIGSGTTLSTYDVTNGLQVVGALPGRADACSAAQYGSKVIIAGPIGRRPVIFEGGGLRNVGIRAPTATPVVTVSNTGPGAFVAGQYYLYVTYRSTSGDTIIESNPSPGILVTFAVNDTIDSIVLPVSSDPQVNQRRIYMTAVAVTATDGANAYLVATIDDNSTVTYTTDIVGPVSTSSTALVYFDHAEAPDATVVGQFLDYTLLGGSQKFPTRLYYSFVGTPDYWDPTTGGRYLDLDLDSGDPIIAIAPLLDRSIVDVGDGKWGIYATGDIERPLAKTRVNDTHGAIGPQASLVINNQQWYIGESDFYISDGYRESNISSPDEPPATAPVYIQALGRTSIQDTLKQRIDWTERNKFCVIEHRARNQIYFCVRLNNGPSWLTGGNTHVFVYDTIQAFWSQYDIPIDCGALAEIASEKAEPVAVVQGWVVKLDQDTGEGAASSAVLTVTNKTVSTGTVLEFAATPFSGLDYRHLRAFVYHKSDHTIQEHRITGVPATNQLLLESNDTTVAIGDLVIVAAAPYYFDLIAAFGDPAATKALLGVATNVELVSATATMRIQHKGDVRTLPSTLSGFNTRSLVLTSSIISRWQALGGFGTNFYVRVSETGYAAGTGVGVFPGGGSFRVHGMSFEGRETASRSRQ